VQESINSRLTASSPSRQGLSSHVREDECHGLALGALWKFDLSNVISHVS